MDENEPTTQPAASHVVRTADLVVAYVAHNSIPAAELPALIAATHAAIAGLGKAAAPAGPQAAKLSPAEIRKSITHEALISFEDGKSYRTLRRHLSLRGLSPEAYRAKWDLPADYPMTAAGYSEKRSTLAKSFGLGQVGGMRAKAEQAPAAAEPPAGEPKAGGRPRKAKATA